MPEQQTYRQIEHTEALRIEHEGKKKETVIMWKKVVAIIAALGMLSGIGVCLANMYVAPENVTTEKPVPVRGSYYGCPYSKRIKKLNTRKKHRLA